MSVYKRKRTQYTNPAGLLQPIPSTKNNTDNTKVHDSTYFPLQPTLFPVGTPIGSKRSRKIYSDLADERQFLIHLKRLWTRKLQDLKEDEKFLNRMKNMSEAELNNVGPLFSLSATNDQEKEKEDEDDEEDITTVEGKPKESESACDHPKTIPPQPITLDDDDLLHNEAELLSTIDNLHRLIQDGKGESSNDIVVNEEENEARKALTLLLREFGDTL